MVPNPYSTVNPAKEGTRIFDESICFCGIQLAKLTMGYYLEWEMSIRSI